MPLYEYECEVCRHRFETIQKFSDAPLERCPECAGRVHKLPSSPAIQFKGSGWYITDYARAGKSEDGKAAKGDGAASPESKGDAGGESKTETKPAAKAEPTKSETKSESKPASPSQS
jgi:putative FmdB family regulatory protein